MTLPASYYEPDWVDQDDDDDEGCSFCGSYLTICDCDEDTW